MFKQFSMAEDPDHQVRQILVLPQENAGEHMNESAAEQLQGFAAFMDTKLAEYKEVLNQNSPAVFAVNYVQNRFISMEFSVQIAKLWEVMGVHTAVEFEKAVEAMKNDPESAAIVNTFEEEVKRYDELLRQIDTELDTKIGPCATVEAPFEELHELGIQSRTITHYVHGSPFDMVLVVIVRTFSNQEVVQHILALYNRMQDFHRQSCDVFILTRGPPIGSRVPFRKLYDEAEANAELKAHRRSALQLAGWSALLKVVEISLIDESRQTPAPENGEKAEDLTAYITQKGGTILINRSGKVLYKFVESERCSWPTVEAVLNEVKKNIADQSTTATKPRAKVQSEISVQQTESSDGAKVEVKKCCSIL